VETSFISNPRERERLSQDEYLNQIVEGLLKGIEGYIKEIKLTGLEMGNKDKGSSAMSSLRD